MSRIRSLQTNQTVKETRKKMMTGTEAETDRGTVTETETGMETGLAAKRTMTVEITTDIAVDTMIGGTGVAAAIMTGTTVVGTIAERGTGAVMVTSSSRMAGGETGHGSAAGGPGTKIPTGMAGGETERNQRRAGRGARSPLWYGKGGALGCGLLVGIKGGSSSGKEGMKVQLGQQERGQQQKQQQLEQEWL
jgi:hypothetical protein